MAKLEISRVHDAYESPGECPLCALLDRVESNYVESFRSGRGMEPTVRTRTNRVGFCPAHMRRLYAGEGKLGLALVMHTHLGETLPRLRADLEALGSAAPEGRKAAARLDEATGRLGRLRESCYICEKLESDLDGFALTILYLWQKDPEFLPVLRGSRGFCIPHFLCILARARETLRPDAVSRWLADVTPLMLSSLEKLERDLFAFTQLHHGTNNSLGTDEERSALARTLQKLSGNLVSPG